MKAAIFEGKGKIAVKDVPDLEIQNAHEAIVRITRSVICGFRPLVLPRTVAACEQSPARRGGHSGL
jgi:alcohol dehydrogenase